MHIGLTYDLREHYLVLGYDDEETAEFDFPETIDAVASALTRIDASVDRIGTLSELLARLHAGERWDLVFNMAEGMHGVGREAQVPALLDAWRIPYTFSDPMVCALCLHKGMTKHVLRGLGLPTPASHVVAEVGDLSEVDLPFPLIAKPIREGNSKGIAPASRVDSAAALAARCSYLLDRFKQPVLVETFLPGRELTVGFIGTGAETTTVGVFEKLLGDEPVYFKYADGFPGRLVDDPVAAHAGELALTAWRAFGCRDGGRVDLRTDESGQPHILEVNPLPGLRPGFSDLPVLCDLAGIAFPDLIVRIVESALRRAEPQAGCAAHLADGRRRTSPMRP